MYQPRRLLPSFHLEQHCCLPCSHIRRRICRPIQLRLKDVVWGDSDSLNLPQRLHFSIRVGYDGYRCLHSKNEWDYEACWAGLINGCFEYFLSIGLLELSSLWQVCLIVPNSSRIQRRDKCALFLFLKYGLWIPLISMVSWLHACRCLLLGCVCLHNAKYVNILYLGTQLSMRNPHHAVHGFVGRILVKVNEIEFIGPLLECRNSLWLLLKYLRQT